METPLSWFLQSFKGHGRHFAELLLLSVVLRTLALVSPSRCRRSSTGSCPMSGRKASV
jgi:ABC-type bacteriocin/lantibiotic exporter with double-glycine peptidase domain